MKPLFASLAAALGMLAASGRASAQSGVHDFHADVEVDPTAYVLSGSSLHVGLGWKRARLDLSLYSIAVPGFAAGDDRFDVSYAGYGVKLQYFLFDEQSGGFVGVDSGLARPLVQLKGTSLASRRTEVDAGVNFGWRFDLPAGLYATPWVGVSYTFNRKDVTLGGSTYSTSAVTIFPAVHLGYRFR
jgi:hypothetical protein